MNIKVGKLIEPKKSSGRALEPGKSMQIGKLKLVNGYEKDTLYVRETARDDRPKKKTRKGPPVGFKKKKKRPTKKSGTKSKAKRPAKVKTKAKAKPAKKRPAKQAKPKLSAGAAAL